MQSGGSRAVPTLTAWRRRAVQGSPARTSSSVLALLSVMSRVAELWPRFKDASAAGDIHRALLTAIQDGAEQDVFMLLAAGADPNHCGGMPRPLYVAVQRGSWPLVKALVHAGADRRAQRAGGFSSCLYEFASDRGEAVSIGRVRSPAWQR